MEGVSRIGPPRTDNIDQKHQRFFTKCACEAEDIFQSRPVDAALQTPDLGNAQASSAGEPVDGQMPLLAVANEHAAERR